MEVAGDVVPLNSHARRDVFLERWSRGWMPGGEKESCGARCRGQTKRGNCMKNRLSLLAVRGRGFRRSCSRCCFSSEECENGRHEGTKKGDGRCRNKCAESDVKEPAFILSPVLYLLLSSHYFQ